MSRSALFRLLGGGVTPARALTDRELERVCSILGRRPTLLVAGGGRGIGGSESVVLAAVAPERVIYADISRGRNPDVQADLARAWPFKAGSFDAVVSTWLLEHVPRPDVLVREACRALRDDGVFVCVVPFLYQVHGSPGDYYRYTDSALRRLAGEAGFGRVDVTMVGGSPFVSCAALLWPFLGLPVLGAVMYLGAVVMDGFLKLIARALGRSGASLRAFPLGYICVARRGGAGDP